MSPVCQEKKESDIGRASRGAEQLTDTLRIKSVRGKAREMFANS